MFELTRIYCFVLAALLVAGGVAGMAEKGSIISLIAGVVCGLLVGVGAFLLPTNLKLGLGLAIVGAALPLGRMLPGFIKNHTIWPAGVVAISAILGIILCVVTLATGGKAR